MNLKTVLKILISRFDDKQITFALSGGLALSTMDIFRFTKDIDFVVREVDKEPVDGIMKDLGYEKQPFSSGEIVSYYSPVKGMGQVDFLIAKRKYTKAMIERSNIQAVFDGELEVRTLKPEDLIGLKIQAISNDPQNRYLVDAPDIQRLLQLHRDHLDMDLIREYFSIFDKEHLLDQWIENAE